MLGGREGPERVGGTSEPPDLIIHQNPCLAIQRHTHKKDPEASRGGWEVWHPKTKIQQDSSCCSLLERRSLKFESNQIDGLLEHILGRNNGISVMDLLSRLMFSPKSSDLP